MSQETLADNFYKIGIDYFVLRRFDEHIDLRVQKWVYPYEYKHNFDRLDKTCLPAREHFSNVFKESPISDAGYAHAQHM